MIFLTLLWCLEVVISSFELFPSDFMGALRFQGLCFPGLENEDDPGQNFG